MDRRGELLYREFFLFSDAILYAKSKLVGDGLLVSGCANLEDCQVQAWAHPDLAGFVLLMPSKSFVVVCKDAAQCEAWIRGIEAAQAELAGSRQSEVKQSPFLLVLTSDVGVPLFGMYNTQPDWQAPVWRPDSSASQCELCSVPFDLLVRRHHCRACGGIYCDQCTSGRLQQSVKPCRLRPNSAPQVPTSLYRPFIR